MDTRPDQNPTTDAEETSFAETALKLGGKSDDEARRTGAIDSADDQVEKLFKPEYQTVNSPAHRVVWDRNVPAELFQSREVETPPDVRKVMDDSLAVVRRHRAAKTLLNEDGKITKQVMQELGGVGYWGLLVDREYGGSGAPFPGQGFGGWTTAPSLLRRCNFFNTRSARSICPCSFWLPGSISSNEFHTSRASWILPLL